MASLVVCIRCVTKATEQMMKGVKREDRRSVEEKDHAPGEGSSL